MIDRIHKPFFHDFEEPEDDDNSNRPLYMHLIEEAEKINGKLRAETRFLRNMLHLAKIAPWEQAAPDLLYLSEEWFKLFEVTEDIFLLKDYVALIDDPEIRNQVLDKRLSLQNAGQGTFWKKDYSLNGRKIRTVCHVFEEGILAGFDMLLETGH